MEMFNLQTTKKLHNHDEIIKKIFSFFYNIKSVSGCFVSGSTASGDMDIDSDLDTGFLIESKEQRNLIWGNRWDWEIAPWFHRFDADHIKPYFIIYLFEPHIKADINLYVNDDLPGFAGSPYKIVWDKNDRLKSWLNDMPDKKNDVIDWSTIIHDDERFWAWLFYLYGHIHRGEYYHSAMQYTAVKDIFEQWTAKLNNKNEFDSRKIEFKQFAKKLINDDYFPKPNKKSLKRALIKTIEYYLTLRNQIDVEQNPKWKTSKQAINKISSLINEL